MAAVTAPWPGVNGKLYRNTNIPAFPFWAEFPFCRDVENPMTFTDNDVSSRTGGGAKQHEPGLMDLALNLTFMWDASDIQILALEGAARFKTAIEWAPMDQERALFGARGFRAVYKCFSWNRKEPVDGQMEVTVEYKPCYAPGFGPSLIVI